MGAAHQDTGTRERSSGALSAPAGLRCLSFLLLSLSLSASAQATLSPIDIAERFAASDSWPEANVYLSDHLTSAFTDSTGTLLTLGDWVRDSVSTSVRSLGESEREAAVAIQLLSPDGETETFTLILRQRPPLRDSVARWEARELLGFALPGFYHILGQQIRACEAWASGEPGAETQIDEVRTVILSMYAESDTMEVPTPEEMCAESAVGSTDRANILLTTASENEWRAFFYRHQSDFAHAVGPDTTRWQAARERLQQEGIRTVDREDGPQGRTVVIIGGILDNVVGFLHAPDPDHLPPVTLQGFGDDLFYGNDVIYLEELAPGWYLYWTT